jgi:predicted negative regulator of RcsB-dependent stress response
MSRALLSFVSALILLPGTARGKAADDLRHAGQALTRRETQAASDAFRRAYESAEATDAERGQALDGLLAAAVEAGRLADLADYLQRRLAAAPAEQRGAAQNALVRVQKARDGHLHGAIGSLVREGPTAPDPGTRRLAESLRLLCVQLARGADEQARLLQAAAANVQATRQAKPERALRRTARPVTVSPPLPVTYADAPLRLAPPPRASLSARARGLALAAPRMPLWTPPASPLAVEKPPAPPRSVARVAARFYQQAVQKAQQFTAEGLTENAKAEYANVIVLFPRTSYAHLAARYALHLFQREFPAGQQGEMLVAYLQWVRAAAGKEGLDYAEYLALQSFSDRAPPEVIAREAGAFVHRFPQSAHLIPVRLQLAVALEQTGKLDLAIETLAPVLDAPAPEGDEAAAKARPKALLVLAWLHLFQGDAEAARPILKQLAEAPDAPPSAADARRLLEQLTGRPPDKALLALPAAPQQSLPALLLKTADALALDGDRERAMDLYTLYLRAGTATDDFTVQRDRITRFKETGRMDE